MVNFHSYVKLPEGTNLMEYDDFDWYHDWYDDYSHWRYQYMGYIPLMI